MDSYKVNKFLLDISWNFRMPFEYLLKVILKKKKSFEQEKKIFQLHFNI